MLKRFGVVAMLAALAALSPALADDRPNVLLIAVDDLNDWIGPMDGHPQAQTPHLERFVADGATVFHNAVCPAPVCCPSRAATLSGFMPHRTGVYGNLSNMLDAELVQENATLPEYFSKHGYHTLSTGKIFHKHATDEGADWGQWAFDTFRRAMPDDKPIRAELTHQRLGLVNGETQDGGPKPRHRWGALSWGPTRDPLEETRDYESAAWAAEQLARPWDDQPFFLALGLSRPHLPWYAPQAFFDLYDLDTLELPEVRADDLDDVRNAKGAVAWKPKADYAWVVANGLEKEAARAYLASVSYADACLGVVLDALEQSGHADNTVVVIWGDHGYHVGEKLRYQKSTLWGESVRMPLVVRVPGQAARANCTRPVNLVDLFPTLISLCGLPEKQLDGRDFSALLTDADAAWDHPGLTVADDGTSVLTEQWHYVEGRAGVRELYRLSDDPMAFTNLMAGAVDGRIDDPALAAVVEALAAHVPRERAEAVPGRGAKLKNKSAASPLDETLKATRDLDALR